MNRPTKEVLVIFLLGVLTTMAILWWTGVLPRHG